MSSMLPSPNAPSIPTNGSGMPVNRYPVKPSHRMEPRGEAAQLHAQIAMISHELRNSLAVVRNATRILGLPVAGTIEGARKLIDRHVVQMDRHIEDLLELSARERGTARLRLSRLDLRVVARNVVDDISLDLARRGHRLSVNLPQQPIFVNADSARLEQVLSNLLMNASKYTPDGGDITLSIERCDEQARIRIRDSGIGMAPALLPRIFDLYAQADPAAPNAEGGHGIGLAVVRNLVELHGGTVKAASAGPGKGSEFTIVLPALQ